MTTPSLEQKAIQIVGAVLDAVRARRAKGSSDSDFVHAIACALDPMDAEVLTACTTLRVGGAPARALLDVIAERQRQISAEGWSLDHDDSHRNGDLAAAAACYALVAGFASRFGFQGLRTGILSCDWWPWGPSAWKPKDARRDLVRAGALILAEIERLDRAQARHASDCAVHNAPAYPPGPCDCGAAT